MSPIVTSDFLTNRVLRGHRFTFSIDEVFNILYFLNVEEPSFPIIKILDRLIRLGHSYDGGAFTVNKDVLSSHLNDVVSVIIHPHLIIFPPCV